MCAQFSEHFKKFFRWGTRRMKGDFIVALIKCYECSAEISDKAKHCPKCGAPVIVHKWRCPKCGNTINEEPCCYCNNEQMVIKNNTDAQTENNTQTVKQNNKSNNGFGKFIGILTSLIILIIIPIIIATSNSQHSKQTVSQNSHDNCMFVGYADPNRKLDGSTIISREPKYGYKAVYTDRRDIYNTYHFH